MGNLSRARLPPGRRRPALLPGLLLLLPMLLAGPAAGGAGAASVPEAIAARLDRLRSAGGIYVRGVAIASGALLPEFYAARNHAPAWDRPARVDEVLALLATAPEHGLDPGDYNLDQLKALWAEGRAQGDPEVAADLDLLLTESLIRFGYHQRFGKVNPQRLEPAWNFSREYRPGQDPLSTLNAALAAPVLAEFLGQWVRREPLYGVLQQRLAEHRALAAAGGWPVIPDGPTLKVGQRDPRVAVLRQRLAVSGDLPASAPAPVFPELFDAPLFVAVQAAQARHALDADGAVGAGTLRALNVPVTDRIDQLRMTLERLRWVADDAAGDAVVVNIAGAEVFVARSGRIAWWRRAVVGKVARQTPIFRGRMTYLELNPTWTVPPTILRQDVLPGIRRNPGYLAANNMRVLDRNGQPVNPATVNWNASPFPYLIRQEAGPKNPLGLIKLMFPNPHAVYLHDTPGRGTAFDRAARSASSGCIRVEDPFELAALVLDDGTTADALEARLAAGRTQRVNLPRPWPVLLLYWTAALDRDGRVRFLPDIYGRDPALLEALNGAVRLEFP